MGERAAAEHEDYRSRLLELQAVRSLEGRAARRDDVPRGAGPVFTNIGPACPVQQRVFARVVYLEEVGGGAQYLLYGAGGDARRPSWTIDCLDYRWDDT